MQTGPGAGSQGQVGEAIDHRQGRKKGVLLKGEVKGLGKLDLRLSTARQETASKCLRTDHVF